MSSTQQTTDSTDNNQPTPTAQKSGMTRRDLLRRSAVGGATLAGVSTGAIRLDHGPVQESEAVAPLVAAGTVAAGTSVGLNVGWALREYDPLGIVDDDVPEGTTEGALNAMIYDTAQTRASTNQSLIVDNKNIAAGIGHNAWADGKLAAIDSLNDQNTQDDVEQHAQDAVLEYKKDVVTNYLKSWNESCREVENILEKLDEHPDADRGLIGNDFDEDLYHETTQWKDEVYFREDYFTHEFDDGEEFDVHGIGQDLRNAENVIDDTDEMIYSPIGQTSHSHGSFTPHSINVSYDDRSVSWMFGVHWQDMFDDIIAEFEEVQDGLEVWVDSVYGDVQSGELNTEELLTPREQAELTSDDEDFPQAIADLQALNVSVDLEREAEIYLPEVSATVYGTLGYGGDATLETGEIDPDEKESTIYITYDVSQGEGTWNAHDDGIDGGVLTFTAEPFVETVYYVDTVAGEIVELTADDFDQNDDDDEWTVDLSDDLDDAITEVDRIKYYAEIEDTQYETIALQDTFEIIRFTDSDGEEYESADFEPSESHSDDNYITEEEWEERQEEHERLIEQYEDAQGDGISIPGVDDVLDGEANGLIGIAVVGLVFVFGILSALNPLS